MLDYAANCATYWSVETLQSGLEKTCRQLGRPTEDVLAELLGLSGSIDEFWQRVKTNLQAKKIRLLFVADVIPLELRRIVEFLDERMDPVEVLAIELRQFASKELKTLVPIVYGQTQEATRKRVGVVARWDEGTLFDKLGRTVGSRELVDRKTDIRMDAKGWRARADLRNWKRERFSLSEVQASGVSINPAYLSSDGNLWLQFGSLEGKPVFGWIRVTTPANAAVQRHQECQFHRRRFDEISNYFIEDNRG